LITPMDRSDNRRTGNARSMCTPSLLEPAVERGADDLT
jgi:hypothetical protein